VFKFAIRCGLAERNPAEFLREVLEPREKGALRGDWGRRAPAFLRALYANEASIGMPTRLALKSA
jgi:hypothetical protein